MGREEEARSGSVEPGGFTLLTDDRITAGSKSYSETHSDQEERDCIDSSLHSNTLKTSCVFLKEEIQSLRGVCLSKIHIIQ